MECAFFIFFLIFLILFAHSAAADSSTSPSPSPSPTPFLRPSTSVVVAIGVLTTLFSLIFLLLLYAKHCKQAAPTSSATADSATRKNSGVDRSVVESLPMFRYASLRSSKIKGRRSRCLECAVCLGRFEGLEVLRLLPKCNHVFHVECVDTWLDAHSTCPLCRYRVDPEDVLLSTTNTHHQDPDPDIEAGKGIMFQLKRISGRHSSAGERGSAAVSSAASSRRKDGQLLGCGGGGGQTQSQSRLKLVARGLQQRWSDVEQSDLPYRRPPEVIMMNGNGSGRGVINSRSVSDMTGVNRFSGRESGNEIQRNGQGQGQGQGQGRMSSLPLTSTVQPTHTVEP